MGWGRSIDGVKELPEPVLGGLPLFLCFPQQLCPASRQLRIVHGSVLKKRGSALRAGRW